MDAIGSYLLHLFAAAAVCTVAIRILRSGGALTVIAKLLCGVFMIYSVMKPLPQLNIHEWGELETELNSRAQSAVAWGEETLKEALSDSIKEKIETYILEKAKEMDADLAVQVEVSDDDIPKPVAVRITGKVSPYAKTRLTDIMINDLGIQKEKQIWI